MKKFYSTILSLALLLIGAVLFASPAQAGIPDAISYCQATASDKNPYVLIKNAPLESLIDKKTGEFKQGGINAGDKVPPFSWDFGGDNHGSNSTGQNWNETLDRNFLDVLKCNPSQIPLPVPTVDFTDSTCILIGGNAVVTNPDSRVSVDGPTRTGKVWNATFSLPTSDTYTVFTWADGTTADKTFSHTLTDPTTDDLWDTKTGGCRTPDTGGGISNEALMLGGGAIGLGMIFLSVATLMKRRETK